MEYKTRLLKDLTEITYKSLRTGKVKNPWVASIDITNRCNLKCSFCYWRRQKHPRELDDKEMIKRMGKLYQGGFRHIMIMGGEPMLRADLANELTKLFPFSFIFTNGTLGFDQANPTIWWLSLDGPEKIHDKLRGKGSFVKAIDNLEASRRPVIAHMTLSKKNFSHIEPLIKTLMKTKAAGIAFSFYNPCMPTDSNAFISLSEREEIMNSILRLRKKYGDFVMFTNQVKNFLDMDKYFTKWNSKDTCFTASEYRSFGSDGNIKYHCPYGKDTPCHVCGCGGVAFRYALGTMDWQTLKIGLFIYKALLVQHLSK